MQTLYKEINGVLVAVDEQGNPIQSVEPNPIIPKWMADTSMGGKKSFSQQIADIIPSAQPPEAQQQQLQIPGGASMQQRGRGEPPPFTRGIQEQQAAGPGYQPKAPPQEQPGEEEPIRNYSKGFTAAGQGIQGQGSDDELQSGLGGGLTGAGAGFAVGGPWGALIGGITGAFSGIMSAKSNRKKAEAAEKQRKEERAQDRATQERWRTEDKTERKQNKKEAKRERSMQRKQQADTAAFANLSKTIATALGNVQKAPPIFYGSSRGNRR